MIELERLNSVHDIAAPGSRDSTDVPTVRDSTKRERRHAVDVLHELKIGSAIAVTVILAKLITSIRDERTLWEILVFLAIWKIAES